MPALKIKQFSRIYFLSGFLRYLENPNCRSHQDYEVGALISNGPWPRAAFVMNCVAAKDTCNQKRKGHPVENLAEWIMLRFADGSWPTKPERRYYSRGIRKAIASEADDEVSLDVWHLHRFSGAADYNLMNANFFPDGSCRRSRDEYRRLSLKKASDALVEKINAHRRKKGRPLMLTMPNRLRQLAAQRRGKSLEAELSALKHKVTFTTLADDLTQLGHDVIAVNKERDVIVVILRGGIARRRFTISTLIDNLGDDEREIFINQEELDQMPPRPPKNPPMGM